MLTDQQKHTEQESVRIIYVSALNTAEETRKSHTLNVQYSFRFIFCGEIGVNCTPIGTEPILKFKKKNMDMWAEDRVWLNEQSEQYQGGHLLVHMVSAGL